MSLAEQEADSDFGLQFLLVLALIYIVLAWVFSSYTWPLAIMAAIPLGLTGAILGHLVMGLQINPMSMLGLFTLTGIIVNDSIILVSAYKNYVESGVEPHQAIEDAVCSRLRAVILTSVTTVAGLFPLMLEVAPMAAAFTPLAAAICFGMIYGTLLVLLVIPALLSMIVSFTDRSQRRSVEHEAFE
jgi:multidrug efflux pump subunit AcrB